MIEPGRPEEYADVAEMFKYLSDGPEYKDSQLACYKKGQV